MAPVYSSSERCEQMLAVFLSDEFVEMGVESDESLSGYISALIFDKTVPADERKSLLLETLQVVIDDAAKCESLVLRLNQKSEEIAKSVARELAGTTTSASTSIVAHTPSLPIDSQALPAATAKKRFDEEKEFLKQSVINQYAVQFDDTVIFDEEGKQRSGLKEAGITAKLSAQESGAAAGDELWRNDNRKRVVEAAAAQRTQSKAEHDKEMLRNKLQREAEALRKEKEKMRVAKKERRSGR